MIERERKRKRDNLSTLEKHNFTCHTYRYRYVGYRQHNAACMYPFFLLHFKLYLCVVYFKISHAIGVFNTAEAKFCRFEIGTIIDTITISNGSRIITVLSHGTSSWMFQKKSVLAIQMRIKIGIYVDRYQKYTAAAAEIVCRRKELNIFMLINSVSVSQCIPIWILAKRLSLSIGSCSRVHIISLIGKRSAFSKCYDLWWHFFPSFIRSTNVCCILPPIHSPARSVEVLSTM